MNSIKWIKLDVDIFNNKKIRKIRRLPAGNDIILVWIYLLTYAGKTNDRGLIYITKDIPLDYEDIADEIDMKVNTIRLAINTFLSFRMIEMNEKGIISVRNWENYQSVEAMERAKKLRSERNRKYYEKKRLTHPILNRDNNICQYCGDIGNSIDHVIPASKKGSDEENNLVTSCQRCNSAKNDLDVIDFFKTRSDIINYETSRKNYILKPYVDAVLPIKQKEPQIKTSYGNLSKTPSVATDIDIDKDIDKDINIYIVEIINYLNTATGKNFNHNSQTSQKHIKARIKEGFKVDDFKKVIDIKTGLTGFEPATSGVTGRRANLTAPQPLSESIG